MRIFNLQGLGAPVKTKKKIKFAEIDFTSHPSFLRLRKVKKINLKLPHTKKTQPTVYGRTGRQTKPRKIEIQVGRWREQR
jgi:hypothetical protein